MRSKKLLLKKLTGYDSAKTYVHKQTFLKIFIECRLNFNSSVHEREMWVFFPKNLAGSDSAVIYVHCHF